MSKPSRSSWALAWAGVLLLFVGSLAAQDTPQNFDDDYAYGNAPYSNPLPAQHHELTPFAPHSFQQWFQPFAPADISDYGNGIKPHTGFFASYERLYWTISKPSTTTIGNNSAEGVFNEFAGPVNEINSLNNSFIGSKFAPGNRFEFGYMENNDYGWLVGIIDRVGQNADLHAQNATVLFNTPSGLLSGFVTATPLPGTTTTTTAFDADLNHNGTFGRSGKDTNGDGIPDTPAATDFGDEVSFVPRFTTLIASNYTALTGVEIMRMYRAPVLHNGGTFEVFGGARFFQVYDRFQVLALGGILDSSQWTMKTQNNIVGGQIGGRLFRQRGRWMLDSQLRGFIGPNFQNNHFLTVIASNSQAIPGVQVRDAPANLSALTSNSVHNRVGVSPGAELRFNAGYQITRAFALKIGYTAIYVGGITRASNNIDYSLPAFGILQHTSNQTMFINGVSAGFEFNR